MMLVQAAFHLGKNVSYAAERFPMAALMLATVCTFTGAALGEERGPLANDRNHTWNDKVADQPRIREIRRRFSQAAVQLAERVEGERLPFEIVAGDRELAAFPAGSRSVGGKSRRRATAVRNRRWRSRTGG